MPECLIVRISTVCVCVCMRERSVVVAELRRDESTRPCTEGRNKSHTAVQAPMYSTPRRRDLRTKKIQQAARSHLYLLLLLLLLFIPNCVCVLIKVNPSRGKLASLLSSPLLSLLLPLPFLCTFFKLLASARSCDGDIDSPRHGFIRIHRKRKEGEPSVRPSVRPFFLAAG